MRSCPPQPEPYSSGFLQVKCGPPERLNEKMLILNFTKTSLCVSTSPARFSPPNAVQQRQG